MRTTLLKSEVRDAVLDAAERLLERYGYRKTTMDDLAREAGIGKGTTYLHFPSKEEVFLGTIDRIVERLQKRLDELVRQEAPAPERLNRMLHERVLFRFDAVQRYPRSLDELFAGVRLQFLARRERYFLEEARLFAQVLEQGRRRGELEFSDAAATAETLLLATNALLPYSLSVEEFGARDDVVRRIERIADLLVRGLLPGKRR